MACFLRGGQPALKHAVSRMCLAVLHYGMSAYLIPAKALLSGSCACLCWLAQVAPASSAPQPPPLQQPQDAREPDSSPALQLQQRSACLPLLGVMPADFTLALQYNGNEVLWQDNPLSGFVHEWSEQRINSAIRKGRSANLLLQKAVLQRTVTQPDLRSDPSFSDDRQGLCEQFAFGLGADAVTVLPQLLTIYQHELLANKLDAATSSALLPPGFDKQDFLDDLTKANTARLAALELPAICLVLKNNEKQTLAWKRLWYDLEYEYFRGLGSLEVEPFEQGGFVGSITCLRMEDMLAFVADKKLSPLQSIDLESLKKAWKNRKVYVLLAQRQQQFVLMFGSRRQHLELAVRPSASLLAQPQFAALDGATDKKTLLGIYAAKAAMQQLQQSFSKPAGSGALFKMLDKLLAAPGVLSSARREGALKALNSLESALAQCCKSEPWEAAAAFVWHDRHSLNLELLPPVALMADATSLPAAAAALVKNSGLYLGLEQTEVLQARNLELLCAAVRLAAVLEGSAAANLLQSVGMQQDLRACLPALQVLLVEQQVALQSVVQQLQNPVIFLAGRLSAKQRLDLSLLVKCRDERQIGATWQGLQQQWQQAAGKLPAARKPQGLPANFLDSEARQLQERKLWFYRAAAPFDTSGWNVSIADGALLVCSSFEQARQVHGLLEQAKAANKTIAGLVARADFALLQGSAESMAFLPRWVEDVFFAELAASCRSMPHVFAADARRDQALFVKYFSLLECRLQADNKLPQRAWLRVAFKGTAKQQAGSNLGLLQALSGSQNLQGSSQLRALLEQAGP